MKKCKKCDFLDNLTTLPIFQIFEKSKEVIERESKNKSKDNTPYNSMSTEHLEACRDYVRSAVAIAELISKNAKK